MSHRRRDEGSILPMVLVMMVIGALVVVPMLDYTVTVFKSNRVVSDRTAESEAAKGGLRVALSDPKNIFLTCDGGGNLTPSNNQPINGISVQTTCTEISEVGPNEALGYVVPVGATAMQLGAEVPAGASGSTESSGPTPPYPATADWWAEPAVAPLTGAKFSTEAEEGKIWMPDLPLIPPTPRTSTPFAMPAAFDCSVFFPGHYTDPVSVSGRTYFTSGVYYFEQPITFASDADVVVGYGLEDFLPASDCADDLQVASNVISGPSTFNISGGGATFVLGDQARLIVDNSAMTSGARIRFNQRYDAADRGGRISIMTVNGDDVTSGDHDVTNVNLIPRSLMLNDVYQVPIDGTGYVPTSSDFTDKARLPQAPTNFTIEDYRYDDGGTPRGLIVVEWDEVIGQDAGGAVIDDYDVWVSGAAGPVCDAADLFVEPGPTADDPAHFTCVVTGLGSGSQTVRLKSVNEVGDSVELSDNENIGTSDPLVGAPAAVTNISVVDGFSDDVAQISWDTPASDLPVERYDVTATAITQDAIANEEPDAFDATTRVDAGGGTVVQLPITDANGDSVTVSIDDSTLRALDPMASVVAIGTTAEVITTALTPGDTYVLPYTASDGTASETALLTVEVESTLRAIPGDAIAVTLPGTTGTPTVTVDDTALVGADPDAVVTVSGLSVDIQTSTGTSPGTYDLPYQVADGVDTFTGVIRFEVDPATTIQPGDGMRIKIRASEPPPPLAVTPYSIVVDGTALTTLDPGASVTVKPGNQVDVDTTAATPYGSYVLPYRFEDATGLLTWSVGAISFTVADPPAPPAPGTPTAYEADALAPVDTPIVVDVPVTHPDGSTLSLTVDASSLLAADPAATVSVSGLSVTIRTIAADGTYLLPYEVTDSIGATADDAIVVVVDRSEAPAGSCSASVAPGTPIMNACEMTLADLPTSNPAAGLGYRFEVVATNTVGTGPAATTAAPYPTAFDGGGTTLVSPTAHSRDLEPWIPIPIIDIDASGSANVEILVSGYVAAPMSRLHIDNPNGFDISVSGGVMVGTFDVTDSRDTGVPDSVPIGFKNDIVLQRKVRITSVARNVTSTAIVEVNEDGAGYAVNEWVVG